MNMTSDTGERVSGKTTDWMAPVHYRPGFVQNPGEAFAALWEGLPWEHRPGTPRREFYANDANVPYTYGRGEGIRTYMPQPLHEVALAIRHDLERVTAARFEVCFINGYSNGSDFLGWHADDSPEMDDARPIAIVSLGAEREIWFRAKALQGPEQVEKLKLGAGSLCMMAPGMQDLYQHRIPKAGFVCGPRISLTFRGYAAPAVSAA